MKKSFYWMMLICLGVFSSSVCAQEIALIQKPVAIPVGQTHEFGFGTVPQHNTMVLLKISSRMNLQSLGGSSQFMRIALNGHEVKAYESRAAGRLVNKPFSSPITPTISEPWYNERNGWRVIYAPDFEAAKQQSFYTGDPYLLVLDVTDLTNPVAENRLSITNTAWNGVTSDLVIGSLDVETKPGSSPMMIASAGSAPIINRGEPAAGAAKYHGKLLPGGGFAIQVGTSTFNFTSAFSYPNAGFNHLSAGSIDHSGQKDWQVKTNVKIGKVIAEGSDYRVVRTVIFGKTHVEISDAITNLHQESPLGLSVRNEVDLNKLPQPQIRLAGSPNPSLNDYYAPGNPSVHVEVPSGALGIIAEDDVFRNQALLYTRSDKNYKLETAGIRTDMLFLGAGKTYTLRWAVYPVAGHDYYDFVNLVRRDWKANFTVHGAVWWMTEPRTNPDTILKMSLSELRNTILQNGIRYVQVTGSWVDRQYGDPHKLAFGTAVFGKDFDSFRNRTREAVQKIHEAVPGTKVLGYYDALRDSSEDNSKKFVDSWFTGADNQALKTDWGGTYDISYKMVPTLTNSFGKAMLRDAKRYMDEMHLDGIFWDEMSGNGIFNSPPLTYNRSDGQTCILDPKTWTIEKEVGITSLLSAPFRMAVIREIQQKGGSVLGNGPVVTRELLHTNVPRMTEIQHNDIYGYQGNLQTPLGYLGGSNSWESFLGAFNHAMLPISTLPYDGKHYGYQHQIMPYLFPFTPIELHAGYMLGKERIIVTHSGSYGWQDEKVLSITRQFDENGKLTEKLFPITCNNKEAKSDVRLGENEAAVLMRLPITFAPTSKVILPSWNAIITVNQYDSNKISLSIRAPHGGILTVKNGAFAIGGKKVVDVHFDNKTQKVNVKNGQAQIVIPSGFGGKCELS